MGIMIEKTNCEICCHQETCERKGLEKTELINQTDGRLGNIVYDSKAFQITLTCKDFHIKM